MHRIVLENASGETLHAVQLRSLIPGDMYRIHSFTQALLSLGRKKVQKYHDVETTEANLEAIQKDTADMLDMVAGAQGYMIAKCCRGFELPDGLEVTAGAEVYRGMLDEGWSTDEIQALYLQLVRWVQESQHSPGLVSSIVGKLDFSPAPKDDLTDS